MQVRIFNKAGIAKYDEILCALREARQGKLPEGFIEDDNFSTPYKFDVELEHIEFKGRFELANYLFEKLQMDRNKNLYFDESGLWTWISAFYFEELTPVKKYGLHVREKAWYILQDPRDFQRSYRHSVAYPCRLISELGQKCDWMLQSPTYRNNEVTEQLGAHKELALNKSVNDLARKLYFNSSNKKLKRKAASKNVSDAGIRRFVTVAKQLQQTYYLDVMNERQIFDILPEEFEHWLK